MKLPNCVRRFTLRSEIDEPSVPESLRGWSIDFSKYVKYSIPLSSVLYNCPTGRSAYIHLKGIRDTRETSAMRKGRYYHLLMEEAYNRVFIEKISVLEKLLRDNGIDIDIYGDIQSATNLLNKFKEFFESLKDCCEVVIHEPSLNGFSFGMSRLKPDILTKSPNIIFDLKLNIQNDLTRHILQITAYSLAAENHFKENFDLGVVIEVDESVGVRLYPFPIGAAERRSFLDLLNQKLPIITSDTLEDPGYPSLEYCERCYLKYLCRPPSL